MASAEISDGSAAGASGPAAAAAQGSVSGTLSGSAEAYIYSATRGWISLGSRETSVALQSADESSVGSASVAADTYTRIRLVLDGFDAYVDAGSNLGGITFDADTDISLGGSEGHVEIVREVTPPTPRPRSASTSTRIPGSTSSRPRARRPRTRRSSRLPPPR
jgi:hypothetical protein